MFTKQHKFSLATFLIVVVYLLLAISPGFVQAAPIAQASEPVIYEGLSFPQVPYASRWIEVNGRRIHYYETGNPGGDPILLLHGIPAWSYLWRNVMPHLEKSGRVIALDFPGFGRSDPMDRYLITDHSAAIAGFVEAMRLEHITLVVQDLGSAAGLHYASAHPDKIKGIVMMEAALPPLFPIDFEHLDQAGAIGQLWSMLLTPEVAATAVLTQNVFIEALLPQMVVKPLDEATLNAYRVPFPNPASRLPILASSPAALHLYGLSTEEFNAPFAQYLDWLTKTDLPVLLLSFTPGVLVNEATVHWAKENIHHLTHVALGAGAHFVQEDQADAIGKTIAEWSEKNFNCKSRAEKCKHRSDEGQK